MCWIQNPKLKITKDAVKIIFGARHTAPALMILSADLQLQI